MPKRTTNFFVQRLSTVLGKCIFLVKNAATITTASVIKDLAIAACIQHRILFVKILKCSLTKIKSTKLMSIIITTN